MKKNTARKAARKKSDPCWIYVLASARGADLRTYVGWSTDPQARLARHNAGRGAKSTRGRHWTIIHLERFMSRRAAMSREWHLKRDRKLRKSLRERFRAQLAAAALADVAGNPLDKPARAADTRPGQIRGQR